MTKIAGFYIIISPKYAFSHLVDLYVIFSTFLHKTSYIPLKVHLYDFSLTIAPV